MENSHESELEIKCYPAVTLQIKFPGSSPGNLPLFIPIYSAPIHLLTRHEKKSVKLCIKN